MENETDMVQDGVQFDPGFIKHMSAIVPNIQYVYDSLNRIKNFNQKKQQFKMYYPKIITLLETYMSFYAGCILWGVYIKTIEHAPLLNNLCYGGEYSEEETLSEVEFIRNYLEQMKKDVKYYMGKDFSFNPEHLKILDAYKTFLVANKGFVATKTTDDIVIPESFNVPSEDELEIICDKINEVDSTGNLKELLPLVMKVI